MQVKKITAKIRDMVKVSLMENGDERAWYNNIEMPDAIKELEMKNFNFNTLLDGKIEFQIHFEQGILPKDFPEKKARKHRAAKPVADTKPTTPVAATPAAIAPKPEVKPDDKPTALATRPESKPNTKPMAAMPADTKPAPDKTMKPAAPPATKTASKVDAKPTAAPTKSEPKPAAKKAI